MPTAPVINTTAKVSTAARARKLAQTLHRNEYGAISPRALLSDTCCKELDAILALAVKLGRLDAPFVRQDRRELECLNHDVYDLQIERGRIRAVVVQERWFWQSLRKTRSRLTKRYVLLTRERRSLREEELDTSTCAKRAKNTSSLGELIGHYTGAKQVRCKTPHVLVGRACKVLARDADGLLRSVFDESVYRVGVWRSEAAASGHGGGYYFYWSEQEALAGLASNNTFADAWKEGKQLVLCAVEVAGRKVEYDNGKHSASRLRVLGELRTLTQPDESACTGDA